MDALLLKEVSALLEELGIIYDYLHDAEFRSSRDGCLSACGSTASRFFDRRAAQ
jgi:hypothetical protein